MRRDYTFSLPKILAALVEQAWGRCVATVPYPDWTKNDVEEVKERRPVGRPRKHPKVLIEGKVGRRTPTDQGVESETKPQPIRKAATKRNPILLETGEVVPTRQPIDGELELISDYRGG